MFCLWLQNAYRTQKFCHKIQHVNFFSEFKWEDSNGSTTILNKSKEIRKRETFCHSCKSDIRLNSLRFVLKIWILEQCNWMLQIVSRDKILYESESVKVIVTQSCLTLWGPHGLQPTRLLCPWDSPGQNTGVGSHSLLQGIFPTQGGNPGLLRCRQILYYLNHQGSLQLHKQIKGSTIVSQLSTLIIALNCLSTVNFPS